MESAMRLISRGRTAKVAPAPKEKTPTPKTPTPTPKTPSPKRKTYKRRPRGEPAGKKMSASQIERIVKGEKDMDENNIRTGILVEARPQRYYAQMEKNLKKFRYDKDQNLAEIRIYGLAERYALPHSKENLSPV